MATKSVLWYDEIDDGIHDILLRQNHLSPGNAYSFIIKELYPIRIYKAMLTMICDLNNHCFGDQYFRNFLMAKDSNKIDTTKYSLFMHLVSPQAVRMGGLFAIVPLHGSKKPILVTEMSAYPIGFALYIDKPKDYIPFGLNIDCFASENYDTKCNVHFSGIPYLDINSQFPVDFRSKDDIIHCIKENSKDTEMG